MEIQENLLDRYRERKPEKGIHSLEHSIAKEITEYFPGEKFGMWLGVAKRLGAGILKAKFNEVKHKGPRYLMACCRNK